MRKTLLQFLTFVLCITGMQNLLLAQEKKPLNQVVNTLKERCSEPGQYIRHQANYFHGTRKDHQTVDL